MKTIEELNTKIEAFIALLPPEEKAAAVLYVGDTLDIAGKEVEVYEVILATLHTVYRYVSYERKNPADTGFHSQKGY